MNNASVPVRRRAAGGMSFGFSDGALAPVELLPWQFQVISRAILRRGRSRSRFSNKRWPM